MVERSEHILAEETHIPRNPWAVLQIPPIFERELRSQLHELVSGFKSRQETVAPHRKAEWEEEGDAHFVVRFQKELEKEGQASDGDGKKQTGRRKQRLRILGDHINHRKEYILLRRDKEAVQIEQREALLPCLQYTALLTKKEQAAFADVSAFLEEDEANTEATISVSELTDAVEWLQRVFEEKLGPEKRPRNVKGLREALKEIQKALVDATELQNKYANLDRYTTALAEALEIEEKILAVERTITGRYHALSWQYHPDANTNDPSAKERFAEVTRAYKALMDADADERERLADDLVFGQHTGLWTKEMQHAARDVTRTLAGVFALELPLSGQNEPCGTCHGSGNVLQQSPDTYYPVPVVCDKCKGEGTIPMAVFELRKAMETVIKDED
jgi:hypothetical protein